MGWKMVRHAFAMVFGNFKQAMMASALPLLIGIALTVLVFFVFNIDYRFFTSMGSGFDAGMEMGQAVDPGNRGSFMLGLLCLMFVYLFVLGWIAVTWHRFILLEEYPGILPKVAGRPIWPYIGKLILISLILILISIPMAIVVGLLASPLAMSGNMTAIVVLGFVVGLVVGTVSTWLWYRFAIALPGTAVGKPMGIGAAWGISKSASKDIFVMALILVGLNIAATVVVSPISSGMPIVGGIIKIALNWIILMVGASVLTTLYGNLVEGRPLVD